jgi:hypothetical protein
MNLAFEVVFLTCSPKWRRHHTVHRRFEVQLLVGLYRTNHRIDLCGFPSSLPIFVPDGEHKFMNNCWRTHFPHQRVLR